MGRAKQATAGGLAVGAEGSVTVSCNNCWVAEIGTEQCTKNWDWIQIIALLQGHVESRS